MSYFGPRVPSYILKHLIEREAQTFRAYLGVGIDDPVDAFEVANWLGIDVENLQNLSYLDKDICQFLLQNDHWSGLTCHLPNGRIVAILNPSHSMRRRQATLMEEVAHIHLRHSPSSITIDSSTGLMKRAYDRLQEQEAYWFGSATLVPKQGLKALYEHGYTRDDVAEHYGVSRDLVAFRTNLHGLAKRAK